MKFDTINGETIITLARNESLVLKFEGKEPQQMKIKNKPSDIELRASGMSIKQEQSPRTYIELYNRWITAFNIIFDRLYAISKKQECSTRKICLNLKIRDYVTSNDRHISLNLCTKNGEIIKNGATIIFNSHLGEADHVAYITASVVSKFFDTVAPDKYDINGSFVSKSIGKYVFDNTCLVVETSNPHIEEVIIGAAECHNLGISSDQLIEDQKQKSITYQIGLDSDMIRCLREAERRSAYIIIHDEEKETSTQKHI